MTVARANTDGLNSSRLEVWDILRDLCSFDIHYSLQTEAALTYDAVYAFAHGMNDLSRATAAQLRPSNVSCGDGLSWAEGTSLFNLISMVDYYGLTGKFQMESPIEQYPF